MAKKPHDFSTMHGRLRYARKEATLSVPQMSERTGLKVDTIKAHESRNKFSEEAARKYARATDFEWMWILHKEGPQRRATALTQTEEAGHNLRKHNRPTAQSLVTIREIDISAGAGGGGEMPAAYKRGKNGWVPAEAIAAEVMFPESWLMSMGLDPSQTDLVRVRGDSMWPEIDDGDWVFVDRRIHQLRTDDVYLIFDGFGVVVKSLAIVRANKKGEAARVRILSANSKYPEEIVPIDDIVIIGRVHFRIGRIVRGRG